MKMNVYIIPDSEIESWSGAAQKHLEKFKACEFEVNENEMIEKLFDCVKDTIFNAEDEK